MRDPARVKAIVGWLLVLVFLIASIMCDSAGPRAKDTLVLGSMGLLCVLAAAYVAYSVKIVIGGTARPMLVLVPAIVLVIGLSIVVPAIHSAVNEVIAVRERAASQSHRP